MHLKKLVSATVIAGLLLAVLPPRAAAGDPPRTTTLRSSVEPAVAEQLAAHRGAWAVPSHGKDGTRAKRAAGQTGGGGGGGGMMAVVLIGLAASAAGTYFVVKELRKQTKQAQGQ